MQHRVENIHSMSIKQWSKSKLDPNHSSTIRTALIVLQQINQYIWNFLRNNKMFISCFFVLVWI